MKSITRKITNRSFSLDFEQTEKVEGSKLAISCETYIVDEDASGYKSLDYIALLCAKVDALERKVAELEKGVK